MMKPTYFLVIFSLLTLLSSKSIAQGLGAEDSTLLAALEQLEALENTAGNTDLVLAEPLFQLAEEYRRRGRFADAHSALDRGMQIVRISGGLYTRDQLPYLEKKIENFSDWGDWESARELMEHLLWLHRTKTTRIDSPLLEDLMELARFHIRGISEDSQEFQTYHFRRASASNWLAVAAAERLWSRTDERLIPMLYSLLHQYHLQTVAVERGGRTGYELREILPGSDLVRDRSDMIQYFYHTGLRLLRQMEDIYNATEPPNAEALAMTRLYKADWHAMYSEREQALESYSAAFNGLLEAGVSRELADRYFSSASLLPETEFHASLSNAMASRMVEPALSGIDLELAAAESALYFAEWSPNFPYVRSPLSRPLSQNLDSNFALFSFNLSGVTEISKWLSRQSAQDFGELLDVTVVKPHASFSQDESELRQRLQSLDIRPRLVDGLPQETSATLVYRPAVYNLP
ncbi:MAG: hypothetical protein MI746_10860 [Pseudomonadales bacterium]|nr:hypothetical protein [Pseudomonadales bacterium]